jgi:hypothetical protein
MEMRETYFTREGCGCLPSQSRCRKCRVGRCMWAERRACASSRGLSGKKDESKMAGHKCMGEFEEHASAS